MNDLQRVLVDTYNNTTSDMVAQAKYTSTVNIVESAEDYRLIVESAEVPLTSVSLDLDAKYKMIIDLDDKTLVYDYLQYGFNYFSLTGELKTVDDFIWWLNDIFMKKTLPVYMGSFQLIKDGIIQFKSPSNITPWDTMKIYINHDLWKVLKEFTIPGVTIEDNNELYYQLSPPSAPSTIVKQEYSTLNELVKFKSVRFYSNLPTTAYLAQDQAVNIMTKQDILTTIILNSETFDILQQNNMIYVPTEFRRIELHGISVVRDFSIEVRIYYKNGMTKALVLKPDDYMNIQLLFEKIIYKGVDSI